MKNAPLPNIEARFRAYAEKLSTALGHADRVEPFQAYCTGLFCAMIDHMDHIMANNLPLQKKC